MKKFLVLCVSVLAVGGVTGCGSKTLTCTQTEEQGSMKMEQTVVAKFTNDKATKVDMTMEMVLDDEYKEFLSTFEKQLSSEFEKLEGKDGVSIKTTTKDNSIKVDLSADLKKISDETKEELDFSDELGTYEETKKEFESQGYTCK